MVSYPKGYLFVPVWCDDGEIKPIVDNDGCISVTESAPINALLSKLQTYYNTSWINQSPIWGYTQSASEIVAVQSDGSANFYVTFTPVPAGYVDMIYVFVGMDTTTASTYMDFEIYIGTSWRAIYRQTTIAAGPPYGLYTPIPLGAGENLRVKFNGTTNLDNLRIVKVGARLKLT